MRPSLNSMKLCTRPARFLQTSCRRLNAGAADVCCSLRRHRGAGLSPRTEHRSASQAAPGSEPGRAGRRNRSRSYAGHRHHGTAGTDARASATRQVVARLSPSRFTSVARQRGACLIDARLLSGDGWGDRTPGRRCLRRRRCRGEEDRPAERRRECA